MTAGTYSSQRPFVRIVVTRSAIGKGQGLKNLVFMTGQTRYSLMRSGQRILCRTVIKDNLFHRALHRMASFAFWQPSLVWVLMTGSAGGA
jgi:hypothetical protein